MSKKPLRIFVCLIFIFLSSCGAVPTAAELANADFGPTMSRAGLEPLADEWFESNLKDPYSRVVTWEKAGPCWFYVGTFYRDQKLTPKFIFGYGLLAGVNAKNSYGAYAMSHLIFGTGDKARRIQQIVHSNYVNKA